MGYEEHLEWRKIGNIMRNVVRLCKKESNWVNSRMYGILRSVFALYTVYIVIIL